MTSNTPINVAVICQKYSNFELMQENIPIQLQPIEIPVNIFKYLFYETDSFNINPNTNSLKSFVSLLPDARLKMDGTPFSLLHEIYSNIEQCLNISIEAIEPSSRIVLNKEVSSIKTLCNLHCQSLVNALRWTDIINMVQNDPNYNYNQPLNISITLVFVSSTEGVSNLNVVMNYCVTGFGSP